MEAYKRHKRIFSFFCIILRPFLKWKFKFSSDVLPVGKDACIVLSNHNSDFDPLLVSISSKDFMYFVASEHVFRQGIWSKLLVWALDPIPRTKADGGVLTVIKMMRRLKKGYSVCIFAEGNRSFHGKTMPILASTGAFVKRSGAKLITYKMKGGYFSHPRWGRSLRRGKMSGHFMNEYSVDQLAKMTVDEINQAISSDLFEDAYESQKLEAVKFKGKRLAEGLESLLFICPACKQLSKLSTYKNRISCECSFSAIYTPYAYLENSLNIPNVETITKWNDWQRSHLKTLLKNNDLDNIFFDKNIEIRKIDKHHKTVEHLKGSMLAKKDRLIIADKIFILEDIIDMALYGRNTIVFSVKKGYYEVKSSPQFCAWKYFLLFDIFRETKNDKNINN